VRLLELEKGSRTVLAILEGDDPESCTVLSFLRECSAQYGGSTKGLAVLFKQYADSGRLGLTSDQFHLANSNEKILQFIKGRLRIFCFEDDGGLVVLTHGALKKTQKADLKEVKKAVRVRDRYLLAKKANQISVVKRKTGAKK